MGPSKYQSDVDALVQNLLEKQKELEEQRLVDEMPQPFSKVVLIQYFFEEYNKKYPQDLTEEQLAIAKMKIVDEIKKVSAMTTKEAKEYFAARDSEHNRRTIFEYCLQSELTEVKTNGEPLSGEERLAFRRKREEDFEAGIFDYPEELKQGAEIALNMRDKEFPPENRRLITSTYDILLKKQSANKDLQGVQKVKK